MPRWLENSHKNLVPLPTYLLKILKLPQNLFQPRWSLLNVKQKKTMRHKKRKKKGEERATRKNQDCCVTFKLEHVTSTQSKDGGVREGKAPSSLFCTSPLSKGPNLSDARQFCLWSQINKVVIWKLAACLKNLRYAAINFGDHFFASPKKGETAVYGYNPALFWVLSVSCWFLAELIFT